MTVDPEGRRDRWSTTVFRGTPWLAAALCAVTTVFWPPQWPAYLLTAIPAGVLWLFVYLAMRQRLRLVRRPVLLLPAVIAWFAYDRSGAGLVEAVQWLLVFTVCFGTTAWLLSKVSRASD